MPLDLAEGLDNIVPPRTQSLPRDTKKIPKRSSTRKLRSADVPLRKSERLKFKVDGLPAKTSSPLNLLKHRKQQS